MTANEMRAAVMEKAHFADEGTLKSMLEAEADTSDAALAAELSQYDGVVARYQSGETRGWSWEEVKKDIAERRAQNGKV